MMRSRRVVGLMAAVVLAGCDAWEGFGKGEDSLGTVDPVTFPAANLGPGGNRTQPGLGLFQETEAFADGAILGYFPYLYPSATHPGLPARPGQRRREPAGSHNRRLQLRCARDRGESPPGHVPLLGAARLHLRRGPRRGPLRPAGPGVRWPAGRHISDGRGRGDQLRPGGGRVVGDRGRSALPALQEPGPGRGGPGRLRPWQGHRQVHGLADHRPRRRRLQVRRRPRHGDPGPHGRDARRGPAEVGLVQPLPAGLPRRRLHPDRAR